MKSYAQIFRVGPLGSGRTTAVANACKSISATMVCINHDHAESVKSMYGISTISMNATFEGRRGPFLVDHFAAQMIIEKYESEISRLDKEVGELMSDNESLCDMEMRLTLSLNNEKELNEKINELEETLDKALKDD